MNQIDLSIHVEDFRAEAPDFGFLGRKTPQRGSNGFGTGRGTRDKSELISLDMYSLVSARAWGLGRHTFRIVSGIRRLALSIKPGQLLDRSGKAEMNRCAAGIRLDTDDTRQL